jgi:hypothetical protein
MKEITPWLEENVITQLEFNNDKEYLESTPAKIRIKSNRNNIAEYLKKWIEQFSEIEIWGDVPAYDWVLFCDLFGGALKLPSNIFYAPFDLATVLRINGHIKPIGQYSGDISRYEFAGLDKTKQHNALEDCKAEKACLEKINNSQL